jgi:hypothetical protein
MSTQQSKTYMSVAETAKLVRKALKAEFPGTKFSVRSDSYAGGASIRVRWTDGPLETQVKAVTSLYNGATFDGMIDLKEYHDSILVDEHGNPRVVHFGADFIFTDRDVSPERIRMYWREIERFAGQKFEKPTTPYGAGPEAKIHPDKAQHGQTSIGVQTHTYDETIPGQLHTATDYPEHVRTLAERIGRVRPWHNKPCPGGDGTYCPGCGRYQGDHRAPHKH